MSADLIETLPLPQRLALSYAPARSRDDVLALLALNARLSGIVRQQGETVIAQMKLAWWRDRFRQDRGDWPVGEPLLALLSHWKGDIGSLESLVDGWEGLLAETLGADEIEQFEKGHALAWTVLGNAYAGDNETYVVGHAAMQWALADLSLHLSDEAERDLVRQRLATLDASKGRLPRDLRPLAVLRGLTLRAVERGVPELLDGPGAMATVLRISMLGR